MRFSTLVLALAAASLSTAHTILTYPGWRGDNLVTNSTFRYGMQWMYPCGGMGMSRNRTLWPVGGGAVAVQPAWNSGHPNALFYVNMGFGNDPANYSYPMVPVFQITGPSANPWPGTFCLPQVPLPVNQHVNIGDNATIQIIEVAVHGASLYNCVDITFADPKDVAAVTNSTCYNSSDVGFQTVFTSASLTGAAEPSVPRGLSSYLIMAPLLLSTVWALL